MKSETNHLKPCRVLANEEWPVLKTVLVDDELACHVGCGWAHFGL